MKNIFFQVLLAVTLSLLLAQFALAAGPGPCGANCQANFTTVQDVEDLVNELTNDGQPGATAVRDVETGVITVTLSDGRLLSVAPVGLALRSQNTAQRRIMETENGGLHLRSQQGLQFQLRSEFHHEAQAIGELLRLGGDNIEWFGNQVEIDSPAGERMCFAPDMELIAGQASGASSVSTDIDGNLQFQYQDGIQQRLFACAHDMVQLRDEVRSTLQQQLQVHTDGTLSVQVDGQLQRFRLEAALRLNGILDQPGFFSEQNRLYFRYRDGWEQEIITLP